MLGFHRIVNQDDGFIIHFCTFRTLGHSTKVVALL
eukprot:SAG11_NODE_824_length_6993_cov_1.875290_5_plen_35_part_00